jgi:hypothetical protein
MPPLPASKANSFLGHYNELAWQLIWVSFYQLTEHLNLAYSALVVQPKKNDALVWAWFWNMLPLARPRASS